MSVSRLEGEGGRETGGIWFQDRWMDWLQKKEKLNRVGFEKNFKINKHFDGILFRVSGCWQTFKKTFQIHKDNNQIKFTMILANHRIPLNGFPYLELKKI